MYTLCIIICLNSHTKPACDQVASGPIMSTEVQASQKTQHLTWPRPDKYIKIEIFRFFRFFLKMYTLCIFA